MDDKSVTAEQSRLEARSKSAVLTQNPGTSPLQPIPQSAELEPQPHVNVKPDADFATTGVLRECVEQSLARYFDDLNGEPPEGLYNLVINEVEQPLLLTVMRQCEQNQSRAAKVLGINRNTLRKKLRQHGINT